MKGGFSTKSNTLRQSARIDQTICHQAPTQCSVCRLPMQTHEVIETRQVFESADWAATVLKFPRSAWVAWA